MDMHTLERRLDNDAYSTLEEFKEDWDLIARNCILYNGLESVYSKMALELQSAFEDEWKTRPLC